MINKLHLNSFVISQTAVLTSKARSKDVRLGCEIEIAPVGLGFAGKGVLQVLFGRGTLQALHCESPAADRGGHGFN